MKTFDQAIRKDADVSDVHAPSSLGRKPGPQWKDPRKASSFRDAISTAYFQHRAPEGDPVVFEMDVRKVEPDKRQIFGWASVMTVDGKPVVDKQDDIIPTEEMEKGAYEFLQFSRDLGDMHQRIGTGRLIESVVCTTEKAKCGLVALSEDGKPMEAWWVGFEVTGAEDWAAFKSGARPELSIGGRASWEGAPE